MLTQDRRDFLMSIDDFTQLKAQLKDLNPADAGEYIAALPDARKGIAFRLLGKEQANEVFEYLPFEVQEELINNLHDREVRALVDAMSPDDRAELFDELPARVVKRLLAQMSPSEREATALLLGYPEATAGRVMTTEYVRLRNDLTVAQAIQKIRRLDADKETIYYTYLTDTNRALEGVVSLRQLIFADPDTEIRSLVCRSLVFVTTHTPQEEVARLMKRHDLLALPVVDREQRLVGIVTIDDVIDILEEEATEDILKLAAVSGGEESTLAAPGVTIRQRLPWLLGVMALYIASASAIAPFQSVIALVPVLAVIMPIFSNTGGTVGIQALTVTIRGLSVGEITPLDTFRILRKEILAGLGTALALGCTLILLSLIWTPPAQRWVAVVAGLVMAINTMVAVILGALLPMGFKRFNLDPALISGPLLTTLLDGIGFMIFLSLISVALKVFA
jgi:magnesium transporter